MSTKTTFKRIALVAVAALGLGVLSVAPSSAGTDETLTLSASTATVAIGDTATVLVTNTYTSSLATNGADSSVIYMAGSGSGSTVQSYVTTDSANVTIGGTNDYLKSSAEGSGIILESSTATAAVAFTKVVISVNFVAPTTAGTYIYTISSRNRANTTVGKTASFTLTVSAAVSAASASKSLNFLNRAAEYASVGGSGAGSDAFNTAAGSSAVAALKADSAIVASAGTVSSPTKVGILWNELRSLNDTKVVSVLNQARITDSITVTVTGPGLIAASGRTVFGIAGVGTLAKQVTMDSQDSLIVYSDGTPGVATITSYLGTSVSASKLMGTAKTVTFTGKATTFTPTLSTLSVGGVLSPSDSATSGVGIITFLAKDSELNAVTSAALNINQGMGAFYAVSSDTKVVRALNSATSQFITCAASATTAGKWSCDANVIDSGTATLTIQDSTTGTAPTSSAAVSLTVTGAGYKGTAAFDKTSYAPGDRALLTLTSKDYAGAVINGSSNPWTSLAWKTQTPGAFTAPTLASDLAGGTFTSLTTYLTGTNSFVSGIDTVVTYMPTTAGTYTLTGLTAGATTASDIVTFTIVDPNAATIAAAKDASDAATDAALEATDAAYAATDAANIAAEAADAATAAAEAATEAANAAKESADAATAAVEELATSVAKLMAALQAQITTLAKVVAKIAVKVKA